jgi:hypothetical protein
MALAVVGAAVGAKFLPKHRVVERRGGPGMLAVPHHVEEPVG